MSLPERWRGKWSQTPTVVLRFRFLLASVTLPQVMNGSSFLYPGSASSTEGKSVGLRRSSKYYFRHLTYILSWNWQHPYHTPQVSELPEDLLESLWGWLKVLMHALTKQIQVFASEPHSTWPYQEGHHPPCSRRSLQQPQQWRWGTWPRGLTVPYFPHNVVKFLLEVGIWHFTDQSVNPTLPAHPHSVFRYATPIQHPVPPPDPAHHQANVAIRCSLVSGI